MLILLSCVQESESVNDLNARLKGEVERLRAEKDRLEKCLTDSRHKSNCKHHRQYDPSNIPSLAIQSPPLPSTSSYPLHTSMNSPSYASPSSSSCCSASSPNSFTSLLSPSADSKDFINSLPSPSSLSLTDCGFGAISVASTASSLDYIEPTIPSDTASTSKATSYKSKGSHRYHPYLYPASPSSVDIPMRQEAILSDYGGPSNRLASTSQYSTHSVIDNTRSQPCEVSTNISYSDNSSISSIYTDTKTNPFRYPVVTSCSNYDQQPIVGKQYIQLEAANNSTSRNEFRKVRPNHGTSMSSAPRYAPYSTNTHRANNQMPIPSFTVTDTSTDVNQSVFSSGVETGVSNVTTTLVDGGVSVAASVSTIEGGLEASSVGVSGSHYDTFSNSQSSYSNAQQNPFFPPGSYTSSGVL